VGVLEEIEGGDEGVNKGDFVWGEDGGEEDKLIDNSKGKGEEGWGSLVLRFEKSVFVEDEVWMRDLCLLEIKKGEEGGVCGVWEDIGEAVKGGRWIKGIISSPSIWLYCLFPQIFSSFIVWSFSLMGSDDDDLVRLIFSPKLGLPVSIK